MADEDLDFEDRFADVPVEPTDDEELAKKKLELLKLAAPPEPPVPQPGAELQAPPPQQEPTARSVPAPAPMPEPVPQTFMQRLFTATAPRFLPGAPLAQAPMPPPEPEITPKDAERVAQVIEEESKNKEELQSFKSRAEPLSSEFQPSELPPSRDVGVRQAGGDIKKFRGFTPEVESAIVKAAKTYGVDPDMLRAFVAIESNGNPNSNRGARTQYKGLMQIGRDEWSKFGQGDIYNANDNIMAGARLLRDNAARFEKAMGRPPTPREQYLMHQQGLGFYTKGTMTNIGGNLPASAKGNRENWTHEGFERFWGNKLESLIAQAKGAQVTGSVPMTELASFMGGEPMATQKAPLTGGLPQTPIAAAQTAELMTRTPLEKIKAITDRMNKAAVAGAIKNQSGQTPQAVRPVRGQQPVEGQLPQAGSVTHTRPDMLPIPGMPQILNVPPQALTSPNVMSTVAAYQAMQPPPPPKAAEAPSFMDKLKGIYTSLTTPAGPDVRDQTLKELRDQIANPDQRGVVDVLKNLSDFDQEFTRGVVGGVSTVPSNLVGGVVAPVAGAAGLVFDSPTLKQFGGQTAQDTEDTRRAILKNFGVNPDMLTPSEKAGMTIGENISPGVAKTLFNAAVSKIAETFIAPNAQTLGEKFPIPSLVTPAHAANVFGRPPVVITTPGGPVVMNDASISGMVYGGVLTMGFGLAASQATRTVRYLRENPVMRDYTDPRRPVPGAPRTQAASIPEDLFKGGTIDSAQAMLDIADRQARYERGTRVGIDPVAADAVYQKYRIQTGAGAANLIHNAITDGNMVTDDFRFNVPNSMGKIKDFSIQNPEFMVYMKARMLFDQLDHNEQLRSALPLTSQRRQRIPTQYTDVEGSVWNITNSRDHIIQAEIDNPQFRRVYHDYLVNLDETRRFVSDGIHNLENPQALDDHTISRPSHPIFSTTQNTQKILDRVLDNDNPLRITEDNMRFALGKQMKYDAEHHYIGTATRDAFTPRSPQWVSQRGQVARENGAVLRRRLDGQTIYYTADPLLVSLMNSGDVPMSGMGRFFSSSKSIFQSATTGAYAPWFAPTGMIRSMEQGWTTAPRGVRTEGGWRVRPAGPLSTAYAIPAQVVPRVLGAVAPTVKWFEDRVSHTPLGQMLGAHTNLISRVFEKAYNDSFYKRMKDAGAYSGNTLEQAKDTHAAIMQAKLTARDPNVGPMFDFMIRASRAWQRFINPANEFLRSVQEAPNFAWAYKAGKTGTPTIEKAGVRRSMSDAELAMRMRDYTGDPATKGFIWSKDISGKPETLRYSGPGQDRAAMYSGVAQAAHGARIVTPWSGVLFQSPASTLAAMRDNPVRANLAFTMTHVMPEMVAYMWNMNQGQEYLDYMMNGRSEQYQNNYIYIAAPGKKPWEGYEIPQYQEGILTRAMTRAFMQQYFGRSMSNMGQDSLKALQGFLKGAVVPPQPSPLTAFLATKGVVMPEGFMGDIYSRRPNPYEELGGGDSWLELTMRGIAPSIADIALQAHEAGKSTPNWGAVPGAAAAQIGKRVASRTVGLRDILGYKPQVAGSTPVSEEMYDKQHIIDDLAKRYRRWDKEGGATGIKGSSKTGMALIAPGMPQLPPNNGEKIPNVGMGQPAPKNPLYKLFMDQMDKAFIKDSPDKGGQGYKSMWKHYTIYTDLMRKMRTVNEGNSAEWVKRQESQPKLMDFLERNKVDPRDYRAVRDFYASRRNEISSKILYTIKATEKRIDQIPQVRQALGPEKHFRIEMVDPNSEELIKKE